MTPRKKPPLGIQIFRRMREEGYYYVDKTLFVAGLVEQGGEAADMPSTAASMPRSRTTGMAPIRWLSTMVISMAFSTAVWPRGASGRSPRMSRIRVGATWPSIMRGRPVCYALIIQSIDIEFLKSERCIVGGRVACNQR